MEEVKETKTGFDYVKEVVNNLVKKSYPDIDVDIKFTMEKAPDGMYLISVFNRPAIIVNKGIVENIYPGVLLNDWIDKDNYVEFMQFILLLDTEIPDIDKLYKQYKVKTSKKGK